MQVRWCNAVRVCANVVTMFDNALQLPARFVDKVTIVRVVFLLHGRFRPPILHQRGHDLSHIIVAN